MRARIDLEHQKKSEGRCQPNPPRIQNPPVDNALWGPEKGDRKMIFGFVTVDAETGCVNTHRDSYLLETLTVVSVRRPLLAGGLMFGFGFLGFGAVFGDLLYAGEIAAVVVSASLALIAGWQIGQLKLLSRDLRGSELSGAVWGRYGHLNKIRGEIVRAIGTHRQGGAL